jgi:Hsp33 protein
MKSSLLSSCATMVLLPLLRNSLYVSGFRHSAGGRFRAENYERFLSSRAPSAARLWSSFEDRETEGGNTKKSQLEVDPLAEFRNPKNREDQVFSAISKDGGIKVTAVTCRNLLNDLMMQQTLSPVSAECLGRTVICSILLANGIQNEQMVQITMNGDGPIRGIVAIATGKGAVRGYVGSPMLGEMALPDAVGKGSVQIVKNHPDWPRPYNGITAIRHGDIDRDIGTSENAAYVRSGFVSALMDNLTR